MVFKRTYNGVLFFSLFLFSANCSKGHPEIVLILLNAGLNAKEKDSFGQTPLHSACIKGDIQCAEMLIKHVNDIHSINHKYQLVINPLL